MSNEYLAGFFDGEGHIAIRKVQKYKGKQYFALNVGATQIDVRPLLMLQEAFGGSIYKSQGRVYKWSLAGGLSFDALNSLLPHLVVKREQALLAIEFQGLRNARLKPDPEEYRDRLKDLRAESQWV